MKKISLFILSILLLSAAITAFSACESYDTYNFYYFSDGKGEFLRRPRVQITISEDREHLYRKENGKTTGENIEIDERSVYVDGELKYYASEYFIAPTETIKGQAVVDDDFNGTLRFGELEECKLNGGVITDLNGEEIGSYSVKNNYVTLNLNGEKRSYLYLRILAQTDETRTLGLFDEFYSMVNVRCDKVENTGFTVSKNVLLESSEGGEIAVTPTTKGYRPETVRYEVLESDGYELDISAGGIYSLKKTSKYPSDKITVKISVDDISKIVEFLPVSVAYDKSLMVMRFVGDEISLDSSFWYLYDNVDPDVVSIENSVVIGAENAYIENKTLHFTNAGYVVIRMVATFNIDGTAYVISDEASINIAEKYIEEQKEN